MKIVRASKDEGPSPVWPALRAIHQILLGTDAPREFTSGRHFPDDLRKYAGWLIPTALLGHSRKEEVFASSILARLENVLSDMEKAMMRKFTISSIVRYILDKEASLVDGVVRLFFFASTRVA